MRTHNSRAVTVLAALFVACNPGSIGSNGDGGTAGGPPGPTVPAAPTGPTAVAGIGSATLSWGAPTSDGGSVLLGYSVTVSPPTPSAVFTVTGTAASVAGLANGTAYTFSVSAFNAIGTGPAAAAPAVVTKDVPGRPTGVVAVPGDQLVNLAWAEPSSTGGSPVTGYSVSVTPASPSAVVTVTGATANVTPLSNGTAYTFTVAAVNAVGTGPASTPSPAVTPSAPTAPPSNLAYSSNPAFYTVATPISPNLPSSSGGAVSSYSVAPALPAQLSLNPVSGAITGTPSAVSAATTYVVTASNSVGSTTVSLTLTINANPPSNLTYATNPAVYTVGTPISPNVPSNTGGAVSSYSVSPGLPAQLSLSPTSGIISGTPMVVSAATAYVVTASNSVGNTTVSLTLTINGPPSNLSYATNPAVYTVGTPISPNVPSNTGGAVSSYSVSPSLPAQLSLSPTSGVISGTPMAVSAATTYVVTASNSVGSTTANVSITVNAAQVAGPFPLSISADKNGLVDTGGKPFVMQGDAAWSAIAQLDEADALTYLNDRQSRGFNTILVNLVEHSFTSHSPNWANANGDIPFTGRVSGSCPSTEGTTYCNDMSTTNDAYFAYVDWFLQQALSRNMLVLLAPAYMGYAGAAGTDGWFNDMSATGTAKLATYGSYIGARYNTQSYPNIIWVNGCDYTPTTSQLTWVTAMVNGMKDGGATQLMTAHWGGEPSFPGYGPSPHPPWLDVDTVYVTSPPNNYQFTLQGWTADNGVRPVFFIEGPYENEYQPPTSPLFLRSDMYQPLLSGEVGFVFGVDPIWNFWDGGAGLKNEYSNDGLFKNWQSALPSPGGEDAVYAAQLMVTLGSPKLVPDLSNSFVTAGSSSGDSGAVAARTSDGHVGVVYFTSTHTITVAMSKMAGSTRARWFDPSNGTYTPISGSPFANSGQQTFTPPASTADGYPDFVLVLQSP